MAFLLSAPEQLRGLSFVLFSTFINLIKAHITLCCHEPFPYSPLSLGGSSLRKLYLLLDVPNVPPVSRICLLLMNPTSSALITTQSFWTIAPTFSFLVSLILVSSLSNLLLTLSAELLPKLNYVYLESSHTFHPSQTLPNIPKP